MNVLILKCGSSSVKFQLIATDVERIARNTDERVAHGIIERIGGESIITLQAEGQPPSSLTAPLRDRRAAVELVLRWACAEESGINEVKSVADGHAVGSFCYRACKYIGSDLAAYVIPTNEELLIARDTVRVIDGVPQRF